ncbi:MAG: peptidoglycan-binding protein [Candidatus Pacebacteria bacterium]|nr:peptidoglycan-binding protein [Candidatus Paceibacterota bacterium]MCF7856890.1 peptidoglycan-binding protein [Candidatus Paceibacterota bacterium]
MNIIANNVASKLFVAFVAAAMLVMLVAPSAKAATADELQAQITALMAQIAALQGSTDASASAACTFTRSLTDGSEGADVKCLQDSLTPTYFNFAGGSTGYFGSVTKSAVAAWQAANGVAPAVGYFGPVSQAKYNAMMAAAPVVTTPDTDDSDSSDDSSTSLSGEASLKDFQIDTASDDTIEESSNDQEIGVATVEFQNGDARITRMDVRLSGVEKVWNIFDEVAIVVDGDEVARMDASSKGDYINTSGNAGTLRFSSLDLVAVEDEEVEITIIASVNNVDTADLGTYTVAVQSMRFVDGTDVTSTLDSTDDSDITSTVNFTIAVAGGDDEIVVKSSSVNPDGTTLELKNNAKSDWYNVFTFDLDTDDSVNDIELTTVVVHLAFSSSTYATFVDKAELVIDGTTIDSVTASTSGMATDLTFDVDGDVTIDAGDRVAAKLNLQFKSLALGNEGVTVTGSVTAANRALIDAVGADDLATSQLSGAATGDPMTLRTSGVTVEKVSMASAVTTGTNDDDDYATYTLTFKVTAFNQDVYISTSPATAVTYTVEDGSSVATTSATTATFSSTGDEVGSSFEVAEGSAETFTLKVTYDPTVTTSTDARVQLETLIFGSTSGTPTGQTWTASPDTDYRTAVETIVN